MRYLIPALFAVLPLAVAGRVPNSRPTIPDSLSPTPDTLGDRLRRDLTPWLDERAKTGDFSGVGNSICGTVVSARENTQVLRLRAVGMTPESGPRCSFTTAGVAANDISQIVQFGWNLSRVFAGKLRDHVRLRLPERLGWANQATCKHYDTANRMEPFSKP